MEVASIGYNAVCCGPNVLLSVFLVCYSCIIWSSAGNDLVALCADHVGRGGEEFGGQRLLLRIVFLSIGGEIQTQNTRPAAFAHQSYPGRKNGSAEADFLVLNGMFIRMNLRIFIQINMQFLHQNGMFI